MGFWWGPVPKGEKITVLTNLKHLLGLVEEEIEPQHIQIHPYLHVCVTTENEERTKDTTKNVSVTTLILIVKSRFPASTFKHVVK